MNSDTEMTLREKEQRTAGAFGITYRVEELKRDLLAVPGVVDVEFDLDGYWSNIPQIIFLPKYAIPVEDEDYYKKRREMLGRILQVCVKHGLTRSGDPIEDYGEYLYIVTYCEWPVKAGVTVPDNSPV